MRVIIKEVDTHRFPLDDSTIHSQPGWTDLIAVGPNEIGRLPFPQRKALLGLDSPLKDQVSLTAFLDSNNGTLYLND